MALPSTGSSMSEPSTPASPARTDAGKVSGYDDYLKSAMQDWTKDTIVPSVVHGAAASDG